MSHENKNRKRSDVKYIKSLLRSSGIKKYDANVVNQLLSVAYNHVTSILEDATEFSRHAQKENIEVSDVNLAITYQNDVKPLSRNELIEIAHDQNHNALPRIQPRDGLKYPSKLCLTETNYELKHEQQRIQDNVKPSNCAAPTQAINAANSTTLLRKYVCQPSTQPAMLAHPMPRFVLKVGQASAAVKKPQ